MVFGIGILVLVVTLIAITATVFTGWVVVSIVRFFVTGTVQTICGTRTRYTRQIAAAAAPVGLRCVRQGCWARNPADARYCRRCGSALPNPQRVVVRRAAVW